MINNNAMAGLVQRILPPREVTINGCDYLFREIGYQHVKGLMALQKKVYRGKIPWSRAAFLEEMNGREPVFYMMLLAGKEPVGFVTARFSDGSGQISNLVVAPDYQGQGLASFLLTEVKEMAKIYGASQLTLEVRVSNLKAQALYQKAGFVIIEELKEYYYKEKEDGYKMCHQLEEGDCV